MNRTILASALLALPLAMVAQNRATFPLTTWQFSRDSIAWEQVSVPHDWAISGPFDKKWDLQMVAIEQNGETEETEKSGRSGALPWIGKGYYITTVYLGDVSNRLATLHFDGAMAEPKVYVNGQFAGEWKYGYTPFDLDVTGLLHNGDNTISVSLENVEESSRWYPGAGLYRPVSLEIASSAALTKPAVQTMGIGEDGKASLAVYTLLKTLDGRESGEVNDYDTYSVVFTLHNAQGRQVGSNTTMPDMNGETSGFINVREPQLWSPEQPTLYTLRASLYKAGTLLDQTETRTGIRTVTVDSINGFQLNGKSRKLKGVCLHHDLGPLGTAINKAALIRQVKQLQDMGCDAIRTAHNIPSQMQMEVYDSLGMMVMAESFDMWRYPKCKNGYARFFDEWNEKDITQLVKATQNHPSLVMYSIGNEIPEQWSEEGRQLSKKLQLLIHQLDPTVPVTQGMDRAEEALKSGFAQVMDVPGFNYRVYKYDRNMKGLNTGFLLGSETASTVSSRGVYKFPVTWGVADEDEDGQCNSYDTEWCSWSNLPEEDFMAQEDKPYTIGQFVWTGYDYLGEPTPYDNYWPSRSSYFGIMDLAGLPKDRYYLYRSVWRQDDHTLHVLPHWTWPGREGEVTPVFVYTDYPEAELFVNGQSQGRQQKDLSVMVDDQSPSTAESAKARATRYRLMWDDVRYEPGELRVVAYDAKGAVAMQKTIRTAGEATALTAIANSTTLRADGNDLSFITVSLADGNGTMLPQADDEITVSVSGAGTFRGICNGDATSLEVFTQPKMKLFSGQLVIVVQAGKQPGKIEVKISDAEKKLDKTLILEAK